MCRVERVIFCFVFFLHCESSLICIYEWRQLSKCFFLFSTVRYLNFYHNTVEILILIAAYSSVIVSLMTPHTDLYNKTSRLFQPLQQAKVDPVINLNDFVLTTDKNNCFIPYKILISYTTDISKTWFKWYKSPEAISGHRHRFLDF